MNWCAPYNTRGCETDLGDGVRSLGTRVPSTPGTDAPNDGTQFYGIEGLAAPGVEKVRLTPGNVVPGTRYRIVRWLGEGGMGVVYEAEHVDIERRVALK